jgi:hypothetical protein
MTGIAFTYVAHVQEHLRSFDLMLSGKDSGPLANYLMASFSSCSRKYEMPRYQQFRIPIQFQSFKVTVT